MHKALDWIAADQIWSSLPRKAATDALHSALSGGLRTDADPLRMALSGENAELLVMPSMDQGQFGVKLVTVAPDNEENGNPRIQGSYILFDKETFAPIALLEASSLTSMRTAAVSMLAIRNRIARFTGDVNIVVFGAGIQAESHVAALVEEFTGTDTSLNLAVVTRSTLVPPHQWTSARQLLSSDSSAVQRVLKDADFVFSATTSSFPLFSAGEVSDDVTIVAVGSHHSDRREIDPIMVGRSTVVVEDLGAAMREAGDVVMAIAEGYLSPNALVPLTSVVNESFVVPADRPFFFKNVGMAWEDLVIAREVVTRIRR